MFRFGFVRSWVVLCLLAASAAVTAHAQISISATPLQLNFSVAVGAVSQQKIVQITSDTPTTLFIQVLSGGSWISVQTGPVNVSGMLDLPVRANAISLGPGSYMGSIKISVQQQPQQSVTVPVYANVGGASALSASPSELTFSATEGASTGSPAQSQVQILSSIGELDYTISVATDVGGSWLLVDANSGTSGGDPFHVAVNPAALAPGTYTGAITVESSDTQDVLQIPVTLTVGSGADLSVTPTMPATFLYQIGDSPPPAQTLTVSASGGAIPFTVAESPDVAWLNVTPLSATAGDNPAIITLTINTAGLVAGAYSTQVVITPLNGTPLPAIPVQLAVSGNPLLQVSKTSFSFSAPLNAVAPEAQSFDITAAGTGATSFTVSSGATWLSATPLSGNTPATVMVSVNPAGLDIGTHRSSLIVRPGNGDQYFHEITVSFTIVDLPTLTAGPAGLLFSYQTGSSPPPSQGVALRSTGQPINFVAFAGTANCGPGWLSVTPSQTVTPATLNVSILTAGLSTGLCSGNLEVRFDAGHGLESILIPVTVAISQSPELRLTFAQGFGIISVTRGQTAPTQDMTLTSTNPNSPVSFTMSASSSGGPWLQVPPSGTTPANISALILSSGLSPGTYSGQISIASPSLATNFIIPVTLNVLPEISVQVTPQSLTFSQAQGGSPSAPQNISLVSNGGAGATFDASISQISGGDWLLLDRTSGAASGDISVSIKSNNLPIGSYTSRILFTFTNAVTLPIQVTVTLNVVNAQTISSSVSQLVFTYDRGGTAPPPQTFTINGSPGPSNFTAGTTSSGWLSLNAMSGTTPAQLTASANITGLAPGTYNGSITITAAGAAGSPLNIAVTLNITGPPKPVIDSVTNNASNVTGPITGGELITLKGTFVPATVDPALFTVTPQNTLSPLLSGVRVLFDGIAGAPIYISRTQINVIVPYEVLSRASISIVVEYQGIQSDPFQIAVATSAPGIYTLDSTGQGQAAALNANGTYNGPGANNTVPSPPGATIVIYLTGGGQSNPPSFSGTVTPSDQLYRIQGNLSAEIGGLPATIEFLGDAPALVTGVIQANVKPDPNVHGNVSVRITINGSTTALGPTVAIQ